MDLIQEFGTRGIEILQKYCKNPKQLSEVLKGKLTDQEIDNLTGQIGELRNKVTTETNTKRRYRIEHWRGDVPAETIETPVFEGKTEQECDDKAIARMNELSSYQIYSWDGLKVSRLDVPGVAEKKTFLQNNGRQQ